MRAEDILRHRARIMTDAQRKAYFDDGFVVMPKLIDEGWLKVLHEIVAGLIEESRSLTRSNSVFDIEPDHTPENPRLRRVSSPCDKEERFWNFLVESPLAHAMADVLGPDVKFYQAKLNFKWAKGGAEVAWHQDQPFFPHTNHAVLTCGIYLNECGRDQGPLTCLPGSHKGKIYDHYDTNGTWRGELQPQDREALDMSKAVELTGPAGSVTFHNYRTLHASRQNLSDEGRPLLLFVASAADAMPYTSQPLKSRFEQAVIAGKPTRVAHHESGYYTMPPDWSGGYTSIFATQKQEAAA